MRVESLVYVRKSNFQISTENQTVIWYIDYMQVLLLLLLLRSNDA